MAKRILIFFIKACCALALFLGLQALIELKTRGFGLQRILSSDLISKRDWEPPALSQEEQDAVACALDQPFTFLGAGSECFAFLSQDQTIVIKFFKLDRFRPIYFIRGLFSEDHRECFGTVSTNDLKLPFGLNGALQRVLGMREYRIARTFNSLKLSYDHFKEETGMLYLHLNPTDSLQKTLLLYDPNGIAHQIDLDHVRFYLQKRAVPLEKHLLRLKETEQLDRAEQSIASLCDLILDRCRKGFADRDPYNKNFGFIGDRAIEIDTGSFIPNPQMQEPRFYKQELLFATLDLRKWAERQFPELLPLIDSSLEKAIAH